MRRYPAYDPPEYADWTPEPREAERWEETLDEHPRRRAVAGELDRAELLRLHDALVQNRLLDIALARWVRRGILSKAWLGTGEEAVTVGSVAALDPSRDHLCPMIRNAGGCPMMGMPLEDLFRGYLATADGPNGGRDLHVGDAAHHVLQPISHMGTNVPVMAGVALGLRRAGEGGVALTFIGDGATKSGEAHEGLHVAAALQLPVLFVLQDNGVALGTRGDQHGVGSLQRWGELYGIPTTHADGNHLLDMHAATVLAVARLREGKGPALIHARTFRMGGHATHDVSEARRTFPAELFRTWGQKDPVGRFEEFLKREGVSTGELEELEEAVTARVETAAETALLSRDRRPDPVQALYDGVSEGGVLVGLERRPVHVV
ncbi:MAG: thiamine pyrophosphate-dependent dehydrogenase E1 component subunit alpha [Gemmatimonadales bacterium]|nr:MAG: thiamine pyrophosphate-dependent dehydrogenase E1 component subunit alpha [Gemmatimonadales bacterium]